MPVDQTNITAKVIADSFHRGSRLTTFEVKSPRFLLAEINTHRVLSRNSASSRAIPVWKRLAEVIYSPFVPMQFGKNKAGMQSAEEISEQDGISAKENWLVSRDIAVLQAFILSGGEDQVLKDSNGNPRAIEVCSWVREKFLEYPDVFAKMRPLSVGIHKQHANRLIEPYAWHTMIATSSRWRNFYALRASKQAQPEIQAMAIAMVTAHKDSVSVVLKRGEWHLPYIKDEDRVEVDDPMVLARIASGRCARVSYLTHDGQRKLEADIDLANGLQNDGHASPFEHPAKVRESSDMYPRGSGGNFGDPWIQFRKMLPNENDFSKLISPSALLEGVKGDKNLSDFILSLHE
jgi:thymidylate synthase ThyX